MALAPGSPSTGLELRDMETALRALPEEQREILLLVALGRNELRRRRANAQDSHRYGHVAPVARP